jgi:TolA-binding protein
VVYLIEEEQRLDSRRIEGGRIEGVALDSKEDNTSGATRDKVKRLEGQIKELTLQIVQIQANYDKRVQVKETQQDIEEDEEEEKEDPNHAKEGSMPQDETVKIGLIKRDRLGIKFELDSSDDYKSTSGSSDDIVRGIDLILN